MWILFRIIALVVVGLSRLLSRLQPSTMPCSGYFQQTAYFEKIENDKHKGLPSLLKYEKYEDIHFIFTNALDINLFATKFKAWIKSG